MKIIYILPVNMLTYGYTFDNFVNTHFSVQVAREVSRQGNKTELHVFWDKTLIHKEKNFTIYFYPSSTNRIFKQKFAQFSLILLRTKLNGDVIHFHEPNRLFFIFFRLTHPRLKLIVEHHGTGIGNPYDKNELMYFLYGILRRLVMPVLLSTCKYYIVHNDKAAYNARQYIKSNRIIVSPNGISHLDYKVYDKDIARKILGFKNEVIYLFVGRINKHKGIMELVMAYEAIEKKNTKLLLVGPLDDNDLKDVIEPYWLGFKQGEELYQIYSASDVFCLPTHFEAFGIVLIEALYYNLPLVVSDLPELKAVAPRRNSIFTSIGSQKDLETALIKMLSVKKRKSLAVGGHEYVLNNYTWRKICKKYIELYKKAVT